MSTVDSYLLISGGNLAYDLIRPSLRQPMDDRALLGLTRWMIGVSATVTIVLALFFQTVVSAWIFMSTTLVATALVPILGGLYLGRLATPMAGLAASLAGLLTALGYYVAIHSFGAFDPEWATQIWTIQAGGVEVSLWQEYALLFALPASFVAYLAGAAYDRGRQ
jgi:Na+/proline symporter